MTQRKPEKTPEEIFARRLQKWMAKCGVTDTALANTLGVSRQAVAYWRKGKRKPQGAHLARLQALMGP